MFGVELILFEKKYSCIWFTEKRLKYMKSKEVLLERYRYRVILRRGKVKKFTER